MFEVYFSKKVRTHICSFSEKECRHISSLPENDAGISVPPEKECRLTWTPPIFNHVFQRPKFGHTIINVPNSGHWILGGDEAGKKLNISS